MVKMMNRFLLCLLMLPGSLANAANLQASDFTQWQPQPAKSRPGTVTAQSTTFQSGDWSYLVAPDETANVEVSATVTIEKPATQFQFFGSSWSAWPDPKFEDRGFEAAVVVRGSPDGASGYRIQLSSKYQELALIRFPDGGYVRSVPCQVKTQTPIRLRVQATGPVLRIHVDDKQLLQYVDQLEPRLDTGRVAIGASSSAQVTFSEFKIQAIQAETPPPAGPHQLRLTSRKWLGGRLFVFDDNEPILELHSEQDPSMFAKLRPGLKPLLTFDSHWGLENQGAYKEASARWTAPAVSGTGPSVTATWSARHVTERYVTRSSLTVGYDSHRNTYTYDVASELEMLPGDPFQFRYGFDFEHHTPLDPFRWQYLMIRDGNGKLTYRPLSPFDPGTLDNIQSYHGLRVWHGRTGDVQRVSPAVEYEIRPDWIATQDDKGNSSRRKLNTAVCAAFYDTGVAFDAVTAKPGDKLRVQYRYTGYPKSETDELFATAQVQDNPRIDPRHHFVFIRDQWPTIRFADALPMDKPWWGGRPLLSGHNARPAYDFVKVDGQGALRLGPVAYAAAAVGPERIEPGRYLISTRVKSVNTHGPGGRIEMLILKKTDLHGNSFVRMDTSNILSEQIRYFGQGTFDWREVSFTVDVPKEATGLALGLGNGGTGEVLISQVKIQPLADSAPPAESLSSTPPAQQTVPDALWDLRMRERLGLYVYNGGSSSYRTLELANIDWVEDEGRTAIRFAENPVSRRDFPLLGILDQNLRNPNYRQNYERVSHGAYAIGGYHGGGEVLKGLTLAAWIKPAPEMGKSEHGGKGDIIGYGARRFILGLNGQTAPYTLVGRINNNDRFESQVKLDANRWHHVALTCQPAGADWQVRLYLNGRLVAEGITKSLPNTATIPDSLILGAELFYLHDAYYRGLMADVLVTGRSSNEQEIKTLAQTIR